MNECIKTKCVKCDIEINENDSEYNRIHLMTHMLIDQLNKMPPEYGSVAMCQLLISNSPYSKEDFLYNMAIAWEELKEKTL